MIQFKLNILKSLGILFLFTVTLISSAQQDPMYTQYSFNTQTINPAYTGTWENPGFLLLARNQWTGMEGTPQTYTISFQTTTKNERVGLGLNIISDKIGREQRLSLFGDYSYMLPLDDKSKLRLGLKFGVTNYKNNLSNYQQYPGPVDPISQGEIDMRFMPNFGIGAYFYSQEYFLGLSIPKIIKNQFSDDNNINNYSTQIEMRHLFFMAGYVFDLSEYLKFKPTFLTKATVGAPVNFEITANFLLKEKVWLGANYRTNTTIGFIAQWIFEEKIRIGYSVDFSLGNLHYLSNGTHEILFSFEIESKRKWTSPRMF